VNLTGALHAEWTKLRTAPGTGWMLLAAIVLTIAVSAAADAGTSCRTGLVCQPDQVKLSLTGIDLGQAVVAVLGAAAIGTEYSTRMIGVTFTAMPRRAAVLAAKAAVLTAVVLPAGMLAAFGSVLAGWLILPGHGFTPAHGYAALSLGEGPVLRAALGSALYLGLIALLSLGIAAVARDPAVAVGCVLGLLYLFPVMTSVISSPHWQRHLDQIGPMNAGLAIAATTGLTSLPLGPWAGLSVLTAWAASALLAGGTLLTLRDV
jgi:ABC-2 type transport system permease protein